jgi:hypothetical protein
MGGRAAPRNVSTKEMQPPSWSCSLIYRKCSPFGLLDACRGQDDAGSGAQSAGQDKRRLRVSLPRRLPSSTPRQMTRVRSPISSSLVPAGSVSQGEPAGRTCGRGVRVDRRSNGRSRLSTPAPPGSHGGRRVVQRPRRRADGGSAQLARRLAASVVRWRAVWPALQLTR